MKNLLFIDDDADIRSLFKSVFSSTYNVSIAASVSEAKKAIKKTQFGVIVSDQCMPNETGLDLFKYMKETNIQKPIKLLLTAVKDVDVVIEAMNGGLVYKYLSKPLNSKEIKKEVNDAFQLYHTNTRRKEIRKRIDQDIEEQNEQISHQLHEGIAQEISAVNFFISSVGKNVKDQQKGVIDESKKLLENTVGGVRKLSNKIIPRIFAQEGLVETLRSIAEEEKEIFLNVLSDGLPPIKKEIELNVLRVIQYLLRHFKSDENVNELDLDLGINSDKELKLILSFSNKAQVEFLEIVEVMIKPYEGNIEYTIDNEYLRISIIYPFVFLGNEE